MQTSGTMRREKAKLYPRHCERSEASIPPLAALWIASLRSH
jgi:hypothetical protein